MAVRAPLLLSFGITLQLTPPISCWWARCGQHQSLNQLKFLSNELRIPVVALGTSEAQEIDAGLAWHGMGKGKGKGR